MASNSASPFRVELSDVEHLQGRAPASTKAPSVPRIPTANALKHDVATSSPVTSVAPFAALAAKHGRPLRVAILSDFTRIPYANGAAFQTRFLYQELRRCGHEVTVIGQHDPAARPEELPPNTVGLPASR